MSTVVAAVAALVSVADTDTRGVTNVDARTRVGNRRYYKKWGHQVRVTHKEKAYA